MRWLLVCLVMVTAVWMTGCDTEDDPRTGTTLTEQTGPAVATTIPTP